MRNIIIRTRNAEGAWNPYEKLGIHKGYAIGIPFGSTLAQTVAIAQYNDGTEELIELGAYKYTDVDSAVVYASYISPADNSKVGFQSFDRFYIGHTMEEARDEALEMANPGDTVQIVDYQQLQLLYEGVKPIPEG